MEDLSRYHAFCHKTLRGFAMVLMLVVAQGCSNPGIQGAEDLLLQELRNSVAKGNPVATHDELASRLEIPQSRVQAIIVGAAGQSRVANQLSANVFGFFAIGNGFTCTGDDECNDLFSGPCRDPRTNGSCTTDENGVVTCTCSLP